MAVHWYVGPWVWDTSGSFPRWRGPSGLSGLDLRHTVDQSAAGGTPGQGVFWGAVGPLVLENRADYQYLGSGSWSDLTPNPTQRSALASAAYGYSPRGNTLILCLTDILTFGSDPDGAANCLPLVPTVDRVLELAASERASTPFRWGELHTSRLKALHRNVFRDAWQAANGQLSRVTQLRRVLDYWMQRFRVDDWREFVPQLIQPDVPGPLPHATTITDAFTRADDATGLGTSSEGWSWSAALENTTLGITSNKASSGTTASGNGVVRAESDLSGSDHYTQAVIQASVDTGGKDLSVLTRFVVGALTHYFFHAKVAADQVELYKRVAGTYTQLGSSVAATMAAATDYTLKGESNGSTQTLYLDGASKISQTDTAIAGNTRAGLRWSIDTTSGTVTFDSFQAADLAATSTPSYAPEVRLGPPIPSAPWHVRVVPQEESGTKGLGRPDLGQQSWPTEIRLGPPIKGAPWSKALPQEEGGTYGARGPFVQSPLAYVTEIKVGPPIMGAPWLRLIPVQEDSSAYGAATPPGPSPVVYAPEVRLGPPMPGAPWHTLVTPPEAATLYGAPFAEDSFNDDFNLDFKVGIATVVTQRDAYAPEVRLGPPMFGAPWRTLILPQEESSAYGAQTPPGPSPRVYAPEMTLGPPIRGAPWLARLPVQEEAGLYGAPTIPPPPHELYAPEMTLGPPMRGAPWLWRVQPREGSGLYGAPAPPGPAPEAYAPEVHAGPPLRGAPWLARLPVPEGGGLLGRVILPGNPGGPSVPASSKPFLPRVQQRDDPRRMARFTEKLSSLVNSLIAQGLLVQTGPDDWELRPGGFAESRAPTATDDVTTGATPGCSWVDTSAGKMYFCRSNTRGAAVWLGPY